jgi:hypothetical protein
MTIDISANNPRISYSVAAGVTQTSFAVPFEFFDDSDLNVYIDTTLQTITTDYTVTGGAGSTGTVTMSVTGPKTVIFTRDTTIERTTDFTAGVDINRAALNTQLDTLTAIAADNQDLGERSIRITDYDPAASNLLLPDAATRADKLLSFDTEGDIQVQAAGDLLTGSILGANYTKASHTGNGTQTAYSTVQSAGSKNNIQVYIDGVYQNKDTFSISGSTLTFSEAPPLNSAIEFIVGNAVTSISGDASAITYDQDGTGAQERTVKSKLQETVSVKDFGAVGDGVTDDTAAIQASIDAIVTAGGGKVFVPRGKYLVSSTIDLAAWYGAPAIIFEGEGYGPWNKDGVVATSEHTSLFVVATDGFNVFNIASTSQTVVQNISIRDTSGSRTSGAAIYLERNGDGIVSDDGNVTGVLIKQVGIKGFQDGIRAIRLQTSTIDQVFIEDCTRDGIRLETTAAGGGTSVTLSNCFVKECGQDNYSMYGMAYSAFVNCASDSSTRHAYYLDGTTRNNTSISFTGCGAEGAGDDGIHITASNFGVTIVGCGIGPTTGDGIYSAGQGVTIIGGKIQSTTGFGINAASGDAVTAIGATFSSNTAGETNSTAKMIQIRNDEKNFMLLGHNVQTGATDSDLVLKNSSGVRSVNNAGTTSADYQIRSSTGDGWIYGVPSSTADHTFAFAGTNRMQFEEENGAAVIRILGEVSSDPGNPAANQARLYLKDNGSGKTQLMVRFGTGAAQVLATEP